MPSTSPRFLPDDPQVNQWTLQTLAWNCEVFSPLVGINEEESPSSLLLDISGCAACFGGESNLVEQLLKAMQGQCFHMRIGVADTIGAAWAVAHFRTRSRTTASVPFGRQEQALRPLPIEALRLSPLTVRKLHDLDVRRVSQLLSLPRKSLPSRFGKELLLRIDQALGHGHESIVPERRPVPIREVWEDESPLQETEALDTIVTALIGRLIKQLDHRGEGVVGLDVQILGTGQPARLSLALLRPTTDCRHVMDLLRLQWERLTLPAGITRVQIDFSESGVLQTKQHRLWETGDRDRRRDADALVEKLSSRLGRDAVLRPVIQAEQQPELAYRFEACVERPRKPDVVPSGTENRVSRFRLSRPLWLKRKPVPVEVVPVVPGGPPYRLSWEGKDRTVARCWGPERITTGWWRGEHVRRDYYHVETADGYRLWLFWDWTQGRWFLHSAFD